MGTVRREGDWRLVKRGNGVYEITFRKKPQMKILTSDASPGRGNQLMFDTLPIREVPSYSEAEGLFEEKAHGPPPFGMEYSSTGQGATGDDFDLSDLPPGGMAFALFLTGVILLYTFLGAGNDIALLLGVGFAGIGLLIFSYGAYLFKTEGWREAWDFLMTVDDDNTSSNSTSSVSTTEKTPPAPENLKNELFFERADRHCEYCGDQFDQPDVHHIVPRRDGGPNTPENLIVLCPNCHRKADRGAISSSKLKWKVKKQMESVAG